MLMQPAPPAGFASLKDLATTWGHEWLKVVVPAAREPPYLVTMQLANYLCDYIPYARALSRASGICQGARGGGGSAAAEEIGGEEEEASYDALYLFYKDFPRTLAQPFVAPPQLQEDFLHDMACEAARQTAQRLAEGAPPAEAPEQGDDPPDLLNEREWLVVGPAGSGSRWHVDPHGTSAWNLLLSGCKLWCIGETQGGRDVREQAAQLARRTLHNPPSALDWFSDVLLLPPESCTAFKRRRCSGADGQGKASISTRRDAKASEEPLAPHSLHFKALWTIQRPGDVVFVPHGTWHCVLNLRDSIAYTRNIVNAVNLRAALAELREVDPHMHHDLAAWAGRDRVS